MEYTLNNDHNNFINQEKEITDLEQTSVSNEPFSKGEIKNSLKKLFYNYGNFQIKEGEFVISHNSIIKILKHTELLPSTKSSVGLKLVDVEIALKKTTNKPKLNETEFINFFVLICQKLDPSLFKKSRKICMQSVFESFIAPFCNIIDSKIISVEEMNSGVFLYKGMEDFINGYTFYDSYNLLLNDIISTLSEIYKIYYHYEINSYSNFSTIIEGSLKSTIEFAKDFDIIPFSISYNQLVIYYNIIISKKLESNNLNELSLVNTHKFKVKNFYNLGQIFKFSTFVEMLLIISELSFQKLTYSGYSKMDENERFLVFLEKLEASKGFLNFERKTNKPHSNSSTLFPQKNTINSINEKYLNKNNFNSEEVIRMNIVTEEINDINNMTEEEISLKQIINLNESNYEMLNRKIPLLKDIFISYTKYSDKLSFMKLNYSAFLKFLKDSNIIQTGNEAKVIRENMLKEKDNTKLSSPKKNKLFKQSIDNFTNSVQGQLTEIDISLIFQTLTGKKHKNNDKKQTNRLDFNLFIKSLELLATKCYQKLQLDQAFNIFFNKDLKKTFENRKHLSMLYNKQMMISIKNSKDENIIILLNLLHDSVLPLYQNYCKNDGLMTFEKFFDFFKDFSIFPEIVNLVQLKNIFFTLAESLTSNDKISKNNYINFPLFLQSFAFSSTFFNYNNADLTNIDRLLYIVERMNHSDGIKKCQIQSGKT